MFRLVIPKGCATISLYEVNASLPHPAPAPATSLAPITAPEDCCCLSPPFPNQVEATPASPPPPHALSSTLWCKRVAGQTHKQSSTLQPSLFLPHLPGQQEGPRGWLLVCKTLQEQPQHSCPCGTDQASEWGRQWKEHSTAG